MPNGDDATAVRAVMDAFNRRDGEAALAQMHPDVRFYPVSTRALGRQDPFVGHDGMREYMDVTEREWEELHIEIVQLQQAKDIVTVLGRATGRSRAGGVLDTTAVWTWKLDAGKVVECRVHADTRKAREALGRD